MYMCVCIHIYTRIYIYSIYVYTCICTYICIYMLDSVQEQENSVLFKSTGDSCDFVVFYFLLFMSFQGVLFSSIFCLIEVR